MVGVETGFTSTQMLCWQVAGPGNRPLQSASQVHPSKLTMVVLSVGPNVGGEDGVVHGAVVVVVKVGRSFITGDNVVVQLVLVGCASFCTQIVWTGSQIVPGVLQSSSHEHPRTSTARVVRATRAKLSENTSALAVVKASTETARNERMGIILVVDVGGKTECWETGNAGCGG